MMKQRKLLIVLSLLVVVVGWGRLEEDPEGHGDGRRRMGGIEFDQVVVIGETGRKRFIALVIEARFLS